MAIDGGKMMSKTQHYRKITKPLLERKRRARMNLYLDELKDLIVETMEEKGEHITKLEKADILELTVTFLKTKARAAIGETSNAEKFREGYTQAAYEVSKVFASIPGIDVRFGTKLMKHLGYKLKEVDAFKERMASMASQRQQEQREQQQASGSNSQGFQEADLQQLSPQRPVERPQQSPPAGPGQDVWRPW